MAGSLFAIIINIVLLKLGGSTAVVAVVIAKKGIETNRSLAAKTNNSEAK